ncbi:MAG: tetratricopeptide repeat protein [Zavarzinella sp.]
MENTVPHFRQNPNQWSKAIPLLILCCLFAYANSVTKTFIFDDDGWLTNAPNLDHPIKYLRGFHTRMTVAAVNLLNHQMGKNNPVSFHITNILIHLAATLVLYGLIRRTLLLPRFENRYFTRATYLAFASALLWMLHPIQTQSVTYLVQRCESMAGLFYMFVLYALVRSADHDQPLPPEARSRFFRSPHTRWGHWKWYLLAGVSMILGYSSKEILATAMIAVVLFDRIFIAPSWKEVSRRWPFYLWVGGIWLAYTIWNIVRSTKAVNNVGFGLDNVTPMQYAYTEIGVMIHYFKITFYPTRLCLDYQTWPWSHSWREVTREMIVVGSILLTSFGLMLWRLPMGFVLFWFFLILAPTSTVMPIADAIFEHRLYLSLATPAILVVFVGDWLLRTVRLQVLAPWLLFVLAAILTILTIRRTEDYRTRTRLWYTVTQVMPKNVRATSNHAHGLIAEGKFEESIPHMERALAMFAYDATSLQNSAFVYEKLGRLDRAEEFYRFIRECGCWPDDDNHVRNHGSSLLAIRKWDEAADAFRYMLSKEPDTASNYYRLGVALHYQGDAAEAKEMFAKATELDPNWTNDLMSPLREMAINRKFMQQTHMQQAIIMWGEIASMNNPQLYLECYDTWAMAYAAAGNYERAAQVLEYALQFSNGGPWYSLLRENLAKYHAKKAPWPPDPE